MIVRRRYHFHLPGVIYMFITLLLAVGAFNSQNNLLYWAFGFAVAILLVSGVVSGAMLMGIRVEREPVAPATAGQPLIVRYRVSNRNRLMPAFALQVLELTPEQVGRRGRSRRLLRRGRPRQDASAGPTWMHHFSQPRGFVAHVGPGQAVVCEAPARAVRRGVATLTLFRVQSTFPFGLVRKSIEFAQQRTVIVRPQVQPPADPSIVGASHRRARGASRPSPRAGDGEEFYALREYAPGDSLRTVAWKRSARADSLQVRQNAALLPDRLWIGVDASPSLEEDRFEAALSAAAGLIDEAVRRDIEVGLVIPSANVRVAPRSGPLQRERLMDELALALRSEAPAHPVHLGDRLIVVRAGAGGAGGTGGASGWPPHAINYTVPPAASEGAPA